ncbi:MAG: RsmD family RNA methyltransferase [Treponema sp.]|nr:RsmD family RNA methyltransferase [Treponema sp.]
MATYTIKAEKMVFGGDCICKIEGKTVFVPYAIPGETLEVEIIKDLRDYSIAKICSIKEPSQYRVIPFCQYYGKCGGCNMQHIQTDYQSRLRADILKDAFEREGVEIPEIQIIKGNPQQYRSRFQFHDGGLMARQSNEIIPIETCPCATPEINAYLREIPYEERPKGRVHVFASNKITSIPEGYDKIIIANEEAAQKKKERKMQERSPSGRKLKKQKKIKSRFEGTTVNPLNLCTVSLRGKNITFDVQGFFQSNIDVLEQAIPNVTEGLNGKNVLDMYAGAGTFSVFLADLFENVCLVEHNRDALVYAEQNLSGLKHESYGLSGDTWIKYHAEKHIQRNGEFDAVVIDPPRSGMEKSVCQWLCSSGIPDIRSISCDIATHARDAKFLTRAGYRIEKLFLLDFYPQTCHIESLAWFTK